MYGVRHLRFTGCVRRLLCFSSSVIVIDHGHSDGYILILSDGHTHVPVVMGRVDPWSFKQSFLPDALRNGSSFQPNPTNNSRFYRYQALHFTSSSVFFSKNGHTPTSNFNAGGLCPALVWISQNLQSGGMQWTRTSTGTTHLHLRQQGSGNRQGWMATYGDRSIIIRLAARMLQGGIFITKTDL